jgi:hypothetical protein
MTHITLGRRVGMEAPHYRQTTFQRGHQIPMQFQGFSGHMANLFRQKTRMPLTHCLSALKARRHQPLDLLYLLTPRDPIHLDCRIACPSSQIPLRLRDLSRYTPYPCPQALTIPPSPPRPRAPVRASAKCYLCKAMRHIRPPFSPLPSPQMASKWLLGLRTTLF